jgi:ATP-binding cassette subfamily C (CFTR/MRP) protein 4
MALKDISFEFGSKEKVAIIGKVGSGKTSLLLTILRELSIVKGSIKISGATHISYAEQNPLIMTGTVQSNIIFGSPLDQAWYDEVVTACALLEDFK